MAGPVVTCPADRPAPVCLPTRTAQACHSHLPCRPLGTRGLPSAREKLHVADVSVSQP